MSVTVGNHFCHWVSTGLSMESVGLYTGYREHQECAYAGCGEKRIIRLARAVPDNAYCAGKLARHGKCACPVCAETRKTWR